MPKLIKSRNVLCFKHSQGRGQILHMLVQQPKEHVELDMNDNGNPQMSEMVNKLARLKIKNPKEEPKVKKQFKNRYISL